MALFDIGLSGMFGGGGAQTPGLLGQLTPQERQQILFGALASMGEGLVRAGASRPMPGGFGSALGQGLTGFNQHMQRAPQQALQQRMVGDEIGFNTAWQGLNPQFQGARTPQQEALMGMIPPQQRAAFWALGPQAGRQALGQLLTRESRAPDGYRMVTGPDGQPRMEAVPGGPADPAQRGRIAEAERDPLLRGEPGQQFFDRRQLGGAPRPPQGGTPRRSAAPNTGPNVMPPPGEDEETLPPWNGEGPPPPPPPFTPLPPGWVTNSPLPPGGTPPTPPRPGQQTAQAQPPRQGPQPVFSVPERQGQEFGTGTEGRVLGLMTSLAPRVMQGTATPAELRQFEAAVTQYTQPRVDISTGVPQYIVPAVPPFVAEAMSRLRGLQAPQAPGQPSVAPQAVPPAQGAPPANVGGNPPPTSLPPMMGQAPAANGLRQIGPGVFQGEPLPPSPRPGQATQNQIETQQFNAQNALGRLTEIRRIAYGADGRIRREFLEIVPQAVNSMNAWIERFGGELTPARRAQLEAYTRFQTATMENVNLTLRELSGAAITPQEAERLMQQLPSLDNSPTQFEARLNQTLRSVELALARQTVARYRGTDWRGIPLESVANAMRDRATHIAADLRRQMVPQTQIEQRVRRAIAEEFGLGASQ